MESVSYRKPIGGRILAYTFLQPGRCDNDAQQPDVKNGEKLGSLDVAGIPYQSSEYLILDVILAARIMRDDSLKLG